MKKTIIKVACILSTLFLLPACATLDSDTLILADDRARKSQAPDIIHRVRPHDSLGEIAAEYTNNAANWEVLARHNGIDNPRQLRIGSSIAIPAYLLEDTETATEPSQKSNTQKVANSQPSVTRATTASLAVQRVPASRANSKVHSDVVIEPVATNRTFHMKPMDRKTMHANAVSKTPPAQIRVSGSYYPKAIYRQPANYSTLILRALPGELFELEQVANGWYKIKTAEGVGYIRKDDGKVVMPGSEQ